MVTLTELKSLTWHYLFSQTNKFLVFGILIHPKNAMVLCET